MAEWWTGSMGGYAGAGIGILGSLMGVYCGLAGTLAPKGIGKRAILGIHILWIAIGLGLLVTAAVALALKQPYHVWYPFALGGFILTLVASILFPVLRMRYKQAEARKLDAQQFRSI